MKLLAVDGNSLINRAFYGIKLLTTKDGHFTNGIYGFITMLNRIMELEKPDSVAVAFDLKKPTFRHKMYDGYKAGRKGMPPELAEQLPVLKEWLSLAGFSVLECEGYEADDILGTLARLSEESGNDCAIASGDRDSLQLVSKTVRVLNTVTKMGRPEIVVYDVDAIKEKYGVEPIKMIDIKALQGDSSDNIPGVPGIGEKTAGSLVSEFGTIDEIYENIDSLNIKDSVKNKLISGKDSAYLSRELGTICKSVPISENLEDYKIKPRDNSRLAALMIKLEFFSLINKMGIDATHVEAQEEHIEEIEFKIVSENELNGNQMDVVIEGSTAAINCGSKIALLNLESETLKSIFENAEIKKNIYDCKNAYKLASKNGFQLNSVCFDGMLAAYLCNPSSSNYEIERLREEYSAPSPKFEVESDELVLNCAKYALVSEKLKEQLKEKELEKLLEEIELPLARVLASMETVGFSVDGEGIRKMGERLASKIDSLQDEIYELAEEPFNINSPKQLGVILFEKLMLPIKKKTKSGYSTNADVLESLINEHPIIEKILEYRKLAKLKSTYCDGLVAVIHSDGRIRSTLNQTETRTGRISSLEPNLQNIPVRTEEGRELRKYFVAKEGYTLVDADYSQIELRVLAHMAGDERMINAFLSGTDIHTVTAAQVFSMPENMVTPLMRSRAKAVNFGIVYGIGAFSLAKDIGVSRKEASEYIYNYLKTYSGVAEFMENVIEAAKETGFVSTLYARRRYLPELSSSNAMIRAAGERIARNMPIQGTAADIIKIAMIKVFERLEKEYPEAHLIMQIHDELIVEAPENVAKEIEAVLSEEMENAAKLLVPLTADANSGKTWFDAKG